MPVLTEASEAPPRVPLPPAVRAVFDEQCHDDAIARTRLWAEKRVQWLFSIGVDLEGEDAGSLIQAALCDVLAGVEPWDPTRFSLGRYVFQIIRARTSKMATRGRPVPIALDDLDERTVDEALERDWTDGVAAADSLLDACRASEGTHRLLAMLRKLAVGDRDVQHVMRALAQGSSGADLLHATGLTRGRYLAARRRLDRLAKRIPVALRAEAGFGPVPATPERAFGEARARCPGRVSNSGSGRGHGARSGWSPHVTARAVAPADGDSSRRRGG
jgi:hypothetical protein